MAHPIQTNLSITYNAGLIQMQAVVTFIYLILFLFLYLATYSYYLSVITLSKTVIILFSVTCLLCKVTANSLNFSLLHFHFMQSYDLICSVVHSSTTF